MKTLRQLKLPLSLTNSKTANTIKSYISLLGPTSGYFSAILYRKDNKCHFLLKDDQFPYVAFDWTVYTMLRVNAKTIVTSGVLMRKQSNIYNDMMGTFGKQELIQMYENNVKEPINLVVYTKSLSCQEIENKISHKIFKNIPLSKFGTELSFKQLANKINQLEMGPTLYENGEKTLGGSLLQIKENEKNFTQMIILSLFQGAMPEKYISDEYNLTAINRDFDKVWQSQIVQSTAKHEDGVEKPITLRFVVYIRKDKPKMTKMIKQ